MAASEEELKQAKAENEQRKQAEQALTEQLEESNAQVERLKLKLLDLQIQLRQQTLFHVS